MMGGTDDTAVKIKGSPEMKLHEMTLHLFLFVIY